LTIYIEMPERDLSLVFGEIKKYYDDLLNRKGIYFLYNYDGELLYVGKSVNLYSRISQHIAGHGRSSLFNRDIYRVDIYFVEDDFSREIYETYAIHRFSPLYNVDKQFRENRSDEALEIDDKINELNTEKAFLKNEVKKLREYFDELVVYSEEDLEFEDLEKWGELLDYERQIEQIDEEIRNLKRRKTEIKHKVGI
jgi:excinuclease UvrABC nuclease subunit